MQRRFFRLNEKDARVDFAVDFMIKKWCSSHLCIFVCFRSKCHKGMSSQDRHQSSAFGIGEIVYCIMVLAQSALCKAEEWNEIFTSPTTMYVILTYTSGTDTDCHEYMFTYSLIWEGKSWRTLESSTLLRRHKFLLVPRMNRCIPIFLHRSNMAFSASVLNNLRYVASLSSAFDFRMNHHSPWCWPWFD